MATRGSRRPFKPVINRLISLAVSRDDLQISVIATKFNLKVHFFQNFLGKRSRPPRKLVLRTFLTVLSLLGKILDPPNEIVTGASS